MNPYVEAVYKPMYSALCGPAFSLTLSYHLVT